ncbi:hypothetical protein [Marinifilum flexuosum]|uniref:hypothetical protein n=1 Tax=Marinifilum flexuosum TaxID=1117708 RepID=UPI0024958B0D|nr:hypothetical protein [Marinifilum flexuosum]
MNKNTKVIEKYYEQIKANIELGLSPADFAKKCVSDYVLIQDNEIKRKREEREKKKKEKNKIIKKQKEQAKANIQEREKDLARTILYTKKMVKPITNTSEIDSKNANISPEQRRANKITKLNINSLSSKIHVTDEVKDLGRLSTKEFDKNTVEGAINSLKMASRMLDLMRGGDDDSDEDYDDIDE